MPPPALGRIDARLDPFLDQRTFVLGKGAKEVEQQFTMRRGGIHLLGQRAEPDALFP